MIQQAVGPFGEERCLLHPAEQEARGLVDRAESRAKPQQLLAGEHPPLSQTVQHPGLVAHSFEGRESARVQDRPGFAGLGEARASLREILFEERVVGLAADPTPRRTGVAPQPLDDLRPLQTIEGLLRDAERHGPILLAFASFSSTGGLAEKDSQ